MVTLTAEPLTLATVLLPVGSVTTSGLGVSGRLLLAVVVVLTTAAGTACFASPNCDVSAVCETAVG